MPEMPAPEAPQVAAAPAAPVTATRMPRVNLMPPEIAEAAAFRRFQLAMGGAVIAALAIVGALYVHEHSGVTSAQKQLADAQSQQSQLQSQLTSLSSVHDVYAQVAAKQQMLQNAMGGEIKWSDYLTDLALKVPDNIWLTAINANETGATPATTTPGTPTLTPTGLGTITFSGVAFKHDDVATWLDVLAKEHGWANPYFTSSAEAAIGNRSVVNFSSSVVLADDAKSGRYIPKAGG